MGRVTKDSRTRQSGFLLALAVTSAGLGGLSLLVRAASDVPASSSTITLDPLGQPGGAAPSPLELTPRTYLSEYLAYNPQQDRLEGVYFQAAVQERYPVVLTRTRPR